METMKGLMRRKTKVKYCPKCHSKLAYTSVLGKYFCKECDYVEYDLYGQMKQLLEDNPALSKVEMSLILDVPIRDLNQFIDDGVLNNPYTDIQ